MITYVKGELVEVNIDNIVIDVGGIGYTIYIPANLFKYLPAVGDMIQVHTYFYVREDAMMLYGFLTRDDLDMFKMLITVSGIGPKGGLGILSTLSTDDLRFAVLSDDAKAIAKAPGIGAKTAQRVIIDLKDKMSLEEAFEKKLEHTTNKVLPENNSIKNDAVLALNALGYSSTESLKAVSKVEITEDMDVEDVLKAALKHMSLF